MFHALEGEEIAPEKLTIPKAKQLFEYIHRQELHINFIRATRGMTGTDKFETVCFEVENEIPQRKLHDVREIERVSVLFFAKDDCYPEVSVMRDDFPTVPHLNLRAYETPKSICLHDQEWDVVNTNWTAARFIERLRFWFSRSSTGTVHQDDQSLEPFFPSSAMKMLVDNGSMSLPENKLLKFFTRAGQGKAVLTTNFKPIDGNSNHKVDIFVVKVESKPVTHGIINKIPRNLQELDNIIHCAKSSIVDKLREKIKLLHSDGEIEEATDAKIVIFLTIPMRRKDTQSIERWAHYGFLLNTDIKRLGEDLGIWQTESNSTALLPPPKSSNNWQSVPVRLLDICYNFTPQMAAYLNGKKSSMDEKITIIGLGALGSKVFDDLARSGYSNFALIDHDILLPHNLSRHSLSEMFIGYRKVHAINALYSNLHSEKIKIASYQSNLLRPNTEEEAEKIAGELKASHTILDISASETVPKYLARDIHIKAPIVSIFLSPSGESLIILKEDRGRKLRVDSLDYFFYRCIITCQEQKDILLSKPSKHRYARSCRDITAVLPTSNISILSGIASKAIDQILLEDDAKVYIWRMSRDMEVKKYTYIPLPVGEHIIGKWSILVGQEVINDTELFRKKKLPVETGGILMGAFDTKRKIIHVCHALTAPGDSKEREEFFIRGKEGLCKDVKEISDITMGNVKYVGEWHSHLQGHTSKASDDDKTALEKLAQTMRKDCLPVVMMIVGDDGYSLNLGE